MKLIDWFKEKRTLINENMKIRKGKFTIEQNLNKITEEFNEMSVKYTHLLEQKSEQFDLYVKYQNQCVELATEKKEVKKQLAESTENNNELLKQIDEYTKTIEKLERKIKRLEKKNEKSA